MRNIARLVVVVSGVAVAVFAATAPARAQDGPPQPTAEHQKLEYFVGNWKSEGEMKASPFGPGGKMTSKDRCEWFEGKFAVVCHTEGKGPMGPMKGIGFMGYNADEEVYTYYGVDNTGMTMMSVPRGTIDGTTWNFESEDSIGGMVVKSRFTIVQDSPKAYSYKWEMQGEGGDWMTIMEGTSRKS